MKTFCKSEEAQMERGASVRESGEEGFMLVAVVVMVAVLLITLSVAAPVVARQLRRDKEMESEHRMEQYVRAIQLYQRKFPGQYPASIKALEGTNNIRFLRQVYVDPLTGKADYKLIHQGEQKTKIHVFFGQELDGLAANLGSASGMQSGGGIGGIGGTSPTSATTVSQGSALSAGFTDATIGTNSPGTSGTTGAAGTTASTSGTNGTSPLGDGTGGVIVGVGTSKSGESISEPNGQGMYESWEFWYDPRIEMLKKSVSITGGGMSSQSASSFGQGLNGQPNSGANGLTNTNSSSGSQTGIGGTGTSSPNSSTPNPF